MLRYLFVLLALEVVSGSAAAQEKPRTGGELVRLKWPSASFLTALASPFN